MVSYWYSKTNEQSEVYDVVNKLHFLCFHFLFLWVFSGMKVLGRQLLAATYYLSFVS